MFSCKIYKKYSTSIIYGIISSWLFSKYLVYICNFLSNLEIASKNIHITQKIMWNHGKSSLFEVYIVYAEIVLIGE